MILDKSQNGFRYPLFHELNIISNCLSPSGNHFINVNLKVGVPLDTATSNRPGTRYTFFGKRS